MAETSIANAKNHLTRLIHEVEGGGGTCAHYPSRQTCCRSAVGRRVCTLSPRPGTRQLLGPHCGNAVRSGIRVVPLNFRDELPY